MIKRNNYNDDKAPNSFIFSLNKMKIYENIKKESNAVCHCPYWGPIFRNDAIVEWNNNFFFSKSINLEINMNLILELWMKIMK